MRWGGSHAQVHQVLLAEGTFHPRVRREGGHEAGAHWKCGWVEVGVPAPLLLFSQRRRVRRVREEGAAGSVEREEKQE